MKAARIFLKCVVLLVVTGGVLCATYIVLNTVCQYGAPMYPPAGMFCVYSVGLSAMTAGMFMSFD